MMLPRTWVTCASCGTAMIGAGHPGELCQPCGKAAEAAAQTARRQSEIWLADGLREIEDIRRTGFLVALSMQCGHIEMFRRDDPLLRERTLECCRHCQPVAMKKHKKENAA